MAKIKAKTKAASAETVQIVQAPWGPVLTQAAFVMTIALVGARALMSEILRDPTVVTPGHPLPPSGAGPATSLILDALCCLPALLVLIRRVIERDYIIRVRWSHAVFGAVAILAAASAMWASDKFAALVTAMHMVTAAVLIWSTTQLVRSWLRLRMIAGICFGLLLAYLAQGLIYRFVDSPETVAHWRMYHDEILKERGLTPGSFGAKQFEKKLLSREMMGFNQSPNSFAAVIVMLTVISAGAALQKRMDKTLVGASVAIALAFPVALCLLWFTGSRTSLGTILIAAGILAIVRVAGTWMGKQPKLAYLAGALFVVLGALALVGYGGIHGRLPGDSLTFRWRYWVAASDLFEQRPLLGIGWSNFGSYYTSVRLPIAAEEIKDPHNFIVRAFTELGVAGGILVIAWIATAAWELTRPVAPPASARTSAQARKSFGTIAAAAIGVIAVNLAASIDWSQPAAFLLVETFRRLLFLVLLMVGTLMVTVRSFKEQEADDRQAPWILYAFLAGLAVFFVHNLVDFSLAEPGPLMLFGMLAGSAMGIRTNWSGNADGRAGAIAALATSTVAWLAVVLVFVLPVADAETQAHAADAALADGDPARASGLYQSAYRSMPLNADYPFSAAKAMDLNENPQRVIATISTAIGRNPREVSYYLARAACEDRTSDPDSAKRDFDKALSLDPNNVGARLDYAEMLERLKERKAAADQYGIALLKNSLLHPDEPKRLEPEKVSQIERKIEELSK